MIKKLLIVVAVIIIGLLVVGFFAISISSLLPVVGTAKQTEAYREFIAVYPNASIEQRGYGADAQLDLSSSGIQLLFDYQLSFEGWKLKDLTVICFNREDNAIVSTRSGSGFNATSSQEVINTIKQRCST